jgi:hypothetical protein
MTFIFQRNYPTWYRYGENVKYVKYLILNVEAGLTDGLALGEDGLVALRLQVDECGVEGQVDNLSGRYGLQQLCQARPSNKVCLEKKKK